MSYSTIRGLKEGRSGLGQRSLAISWRTRALLYALDYSQLASLLPLDFAKPSRNGHRIKGRGRKGLKQEELSRESWCTCTLLCHWSDLSRVTTSSHKTCWECSSSLPQSVESWAQGRPEQTQISQLARAGRMDGEGKTSGCVCHSIRP